MKIHQLNCILKVDEAGSIRTAAQKLGRSPTAVSKTLRELERDVGMVLVDRTPDGVTLNVAGKKLVEHARLIMSRVREAHEEVALVNGAKGGHLSISASPWIVAPLIGPALLQFSERRPDVQISIREHLGDQYPGLRDGRIDISFGPTPPDDQANQFDVRPLFSYGCAVLARNGHPAENATSWDELAPYGWIATNEFLRVPSPLWDALEGDGERGIRRLHYAESMFSLLSMLRSTNMLAIVPKPVIEIPGVRLTFSPLNLEHPGTTEACLVTRKDDMLSSAAVDFLECFEAVRAGFPASDNPIAKQISALVEPVEIEP